MKKTITSLLILLLLSTVACFQGEQNRTSPANDDTLSVEAGDDELMEVKIIQFDTITVSILLPKDWEIIYYNGGPDLPHVEQSYTFEIYPSTGDALGLVTVGNTMRDDVLSEEEFGLWFSSFTERFLPFSVEETAEVTNYSLRNGYGVLSIFTDAALVGTIPPPDEYLYLGLFLGSWGDGFVLHSSLLSNEIDSFEMTLMLLALMHISFSHNIL
ncbi:MAG: hypothetical protein LBC96_01575 [Lachnospiraceae bacterium]|jgi:hypothetical protein|nr:hypothetical protein [Lachnospiraceae bacterium]